MDPEAGWRKPAPKLEESVGPAALWEDAEAGTTGVDVRSKVEALRDGGPWKSEGGGRRDVGGLDAISGFSRLVCSKAEANTGASPKNLSAHLESW